MASDELADLSTEDLVRRLQQAEQLVSMWYSIECMSFATVEARHVEFQALFILVAIHPVESLSGSAGHLTKLVSPLLAASARAAQGQQLTGRAEGCKRAKCHCGMFLPTIDCIECPVALKSLQSLCWPAAKAGRTGGRVHCEQVDEALGSAEARETSFGKRGLYRRYRRF